MPTITDTITTADGTCPVTLHTPDGDGPWPGIVMYPDAGGARQTFREMARQAGRLGYAVLVPDVYYRDGDWAPFEMATVFSDAGERKRLFVDDLEGDAGHHGRRRRRVLRLPGVAARGQRRDVRDHRLLHGRADVAGGRGPGPAAGCGGDVVSRRRPGGRRPRQPAPARRPDEGGRLRRRRRERRVLHDRAAETLDKALTAANVEHTIEFYEAAHGFAVPDNAPYDSAAAQRHWDAMKSFFGTHLG